MSEETVVAIIPLYNGESFVKTALTSVLNQSRPLDEIIVVDDGSTDNGAEIVMHFSRSHPITLLKKTNGGQSSARNHGVAHSKSELIAFLDQDDIWYPNHIEELLKPFRVESRGVPLGWVYSNLDEIDGAGNFVNRGVLSILPISHPKMHLVNCLREDMFILPSASLVLRSAFQAVGGFDERLSGYEDDDLFLRLFRAGWDNVFIDKPLSQWRIYSGSTSFSARMGRSRLIYFEKLCAQFPDQPERNVYYIRDLLSPRFVRNIMHDYNAAIGARQKDRAVAAARQLGIVSKYLRGRQRVVVSMASTILSNPVLGQSALAIRYWTKRIRSVL